MLTRIQNLLVFRLEQLMMRGPFARFGFVLVVLALVVVLLPDLPQTFKVVLLLPVPGAGRRWSLLVVLVPCCRSEKFKCSSLTLSPPNKLLSA